jgi:hypothetical protein
LAVEYILHDGAVRPLIGLYSAYKTDDELWCELTNVLGRVAVHERAARQIVTGAGTGTGSKKKMKMAKV